jgi:hypothetical protein
MHIEHDGPDPRLSRGLGQALCLGALALAALPPLREAALPIGSAAWLLVLPLVALATLHRNALRAAWHGGRRRAPSPASRRPAGDHAPAAAGARRAGFVANAARASVPGSTSGARHASHDPVSRVRVATGKRRSPRHDTRSQPVAGRRHR